MLLDLELIVDPPPCETCPLTTLCREQRQACEQFKSFVTFGGRRWRAEARVPSCEQYERLFRDIAA